jgi:pilus assembly protein Flp/PilA
MASEMKLNRPTLLTRLQNLISREEGQDLIEYALVVALIAFAATAGMNTVAANINTAFTNVGTTLTTYTA